MKNSSIGLVLMTAMSTLGVGCNDAARCSNRCARLVECELISASEENSCQSSCEEDLESIDDEACRDASSDFVNCLSFASCSALEDGSACGSDFEEVITVCAEAEEIPNDEMSNSNTNNNTNDDSNMSVDESAAFSTGASSWADDDAFSGITSISSVAGGVEFTYSIDNGTGGSGVPLETALFALDPVANPVTNFVSFDWTYSGNHRFFMADAYLEFNGRARRVMVDETVRGDFAFSGRVSDYVIVEGDSLTVEVGGGNFDSNSRIEGTVRLTNFTYR